MGIIMRKIHRDAHIKRRIMDKAVRHLKYNDGIKDILDKIKSKVSEIANQFKDAPGGRKILSLLFSALSAANAVYATKSIVDLKRDIRVLNTYNKSIKKGIEHYQRIYGQQFELSEKGKQILSEHKLQVFITSLKLVMSLMVTFVSAVNAKLAIAQKQVQEGEDEGQVIAETMTR